MRTITMIFGVYIVPAEKLRTHGYCVLKVKQGPIRDTCHQSPWKASYADIYIGRQTDRRGNALIHTMCVVATTCHVSQLLHRSQSRVFLMLITDTIVTNWVCAIIVIMFIILSSVFSCDRVRSESFNQKPELRASVRRAHRWVRHLFHLLLCPQSRICLMYEVVLLKITLRKKVSCTSLNYVRCL